MKRLAIITTHPIQYYAPLFQILASDTNLVIKVFYTWGENSMKKHDPGFEREIKWDIPLLDGYDYEFLVNTASSPGSHNFNGIINPDAIERIKSFEPEALLIFGWSYNSHLKIIRHFKNKLPVWFRGDSTLLDRMNGVRNIIKALFLRWIYSQIDKAFYVGTNNKAYFLKYGVREYQLVFSPHSVDNERFSIPNIEDSLKLRKELKVADNQILLLFAGKFEEKKDPLILIQAFIDADLSHVHLLFVGNGPLEEQLKQTGKLAERIHFMDFQNQKMMPSLYQACNLFCLPSKGPGETWGLAVNEAMACGKAILVSDKVGCAKDLVHSNYNGDVFIAGNKLDLSEKLRKLCDFERLIEFGNASKNIIKRWSLQNTASSLIKEMQHEN